MFLTWNPHPRAYGNFARLLGKYVREENVISPEDAIRRLTSLPASNLRLPGRGCLAKGCFADVVVFDPQRIADHATFENRTSSRPGSRTCSSTASRSCATASTPVRHQGDF